MADQEKKFIIEIYRKKDPDQLTAILADPEGKLELGSAAALCGAEACALTLRAARIAQKRQEGNEQLDYILRNAEKLRAYLVYLIDEDVKGRNILRRARKEGEERKIEAALHPAAAISDEVICQMINLVELMEGLLPFLSKENASSLGSALELALGSIRCARQCVLELASESTDETYAFIVRRENELRAEELRPRADRIRSAVEVQLR